MEKPRSSQEVNGIVIFLLYTVKLPSCTNIVVARAGLLGSSRIHFFCSIPGYSWFRDFFCEVICLGEKRSKAIGTVIFLAINYAVLISLALLSLFCRRVSSNGLNTQHNNVRRFIGILCIAFILGMVTLKYFFGMSYATRVQIMLNVLVAALAADFLVNYALSKPVMKYVSVLLIIYFITASTYYNTTKFKAIVNRSQKQYTYYLEYEKPVIDKLADVTTTKDRIFTTKDAFSAMIMAIMPRYGMIAHTDGNYFYLNSELSAKIIADYNTILAARSIDTIDAIMDKYSMKYVLLHKGDRFPGLLVMHRNYRRIYESNLFIILKKDRGL